MQPQRVVVKRYLRPTVSCDFIGNLIKTLRFCQTKLVSGDCRFHTFFEQAEAQEDEKAKNCAGKDGGGGEGRETVPVILTFPDTIGNLVIKASTV